MKYVLKYRSVDCVVVGVGKQLLESHPFVRDAGMEYLLVTRPDEGVFKLHGKYLNGGGHYDETIELGTPFKIPRTGASYILTLASNESVSLDRVEQYY
ncbi:MAG: hypothetical protein PHT88_02360 [Candidatus Moranbacteria bacterium]|nr:hypothetical protein [Candidatus Moranbacteria bacterium]